MGKDISMMSLLTVLPFGAILGVIKWYLGFRVTIKSHEIKSLELVDKLKYDSDEAKNNFIRSSIFSILTKRTTCIHHINIMFNTYDPRRLLMIYSKAPAFVAFSGTDVTKPKRLEYLISKAILFILLALMISAPFIFLIIDNFWQTTYFQFQKPVGFFLMLPFTYYGTRETIFLFEVLRYYHDKSTFSFTNAE
jgi:hypothetical protein